MRNLARVIPLRDTPISAAQRSLDQKHQDASHLAAFFFGAVAGALVAVAVLL